MAQNFDLVGISKRYIGNVVQLTEEGESTSICDFQI